MLTHSRIDKLFPPRRFNDSSVSDMLATREKNIYVIERSEKYDPSNWIRYIAKSGDYSIRLK